MENPEFETRFADFRIQTKLIQPRCRKMWHQWIFGQKSLNNGIWLYWNDGSDVLPAE